MNIGGRRLIAVSGWLGMLALVASLVLSDIQPTRADGDAAVSFENWAGAAHRRTAEIPLRSATAPNYHAYDPKSVTLDLIVDRTGVVVSAQAIAGPAGFRSQAIAQARGWIYRPFTVDGVPVMARIREWIPIYPRVDLPAKHVAFPSVRHAESARITLEKTGCEGSCPSYEVEIDGDGTVTYDGRMFVTVAGRHHDRISREAVTALIEQFRRADFFSMRDAYRPRITIYDLPSATTSIAIDGHVKSVFDYDGDEYGMPAVVHELYRQIDRVAGTEKWLIGNADTVASLRREGWNFAAEDAANLLARVVARGSDRSLDLVRDLIAAGVSPNGRGRWPSPCLAMTALACAAARADVPMVELLIAAGAAKNDTRQMTEALFAAVITGNVALARRLIALSADPDATSDHGRTMLMAAAASGQPTMVAEILRHHPNVDARDDQGRTAIFFWRGSITTIPIPRSDDERADHVPTDDPGAVIDLLARAGADLNARDQSGSSALHVAVAEQAAVAEQVMEALIRGGANVNIRDNSGRSPLMVVVSLRIKNLLLQAGARTGDQP